MKIRWSRRWSKSIIFRKAFPTKSNCWPQPAAGAAAPAARLVPLAFVGMILQGLATVSLFDGSLHGTRATKRIGTQPGWSCRFLWNAFFQSIAMIVFHISYLYKSHYNILYSYICNIFSIDLCATWTCNHLHLCLMYMICMMYTAVMMCLFAQSRCIRMNRSFFCLSRGSWCGVSSW